MSKPFGTRNKRMPDFKVLDFMFDKPERKALKQSYSCFTEEMYLGEVAEFGRRPISDSGILVMRNAKESSRDMEARDLPSSLELIFQSSINPKK